MRKVLRSSPGFVGVFMMFPLAVWAQVDASGPIVRIQEGAVRGVTTNEVTSFKGIPYAEPPVGALRWRAPHPVKPWAQTLDASHFGASCMQTDDLPKSEDCLTLNVWRPAKESGSLPVMVWIYGGALAHGNTPQYPGEALARKGVVFVSMNYRMGRLGFFAHPALTSEATDEVQGNYGYLDQQAALKWVQRNIAAFGGDPKQVTIFGESAGGGSVMVHLVSPMSRGLFQRAILQSPGIPTGRAKALPLTLLVDAEKSGIAYAKSVGITGDGAQALAALRALPAEKLLENASAKEVLVGLASSKPIPGVPGSILDGRLVPAAPETLFAEGKQAAVPVIVGANDRDLGLGMAASKDALFAPFAALGSEARAAYDPQSDQTLEELKQDVLADQTLVEPSRHLADAIARSGNPVHLYRFSYVAESQRGKLKGTLHGFEIPYTLDIPAALVRDKVTPDDRAMAAQASDYWVSFAKTGDPNGAGRPNWPRHDPEVDRLLHFTNDGVIVGTDPLKLRLDLVKKMREQQR